MRLPSGETRGAPTALTFNCSSGSHVCAETAETKRTTRMEAIVRGFMLGLLEVMCGFFYHTSTHYTQIFPRLPRMKLLILLLLLAFTFTEAVAQIAYIRNGTEIRLIEPDGTNDRRLWTHADATP